MGVGTAGRATTHRAAKESRSFATDENGIATARFDRIRDTVGTFTFTVDDVVLGEWTYDSLANVEITDSITIP